MLVSTTPNPALNCTNLVIKVGDVSLDTGASLIVEARNDRGIIIRSDRLIIPELPNLKVGNKEVLAIEFLAGTILAESQLSLNIKMTPNPVADERGVSFFVATTAILNSYRLCIKPGEFDPSGTVRLQGELYTEDEQLIDRYIFAIVLPDVIVEGQVQSVATFIKSRALQLFELSEVV